MQTHLNVVMRKAGTDKKGKPLAPKIFITLMDDTQIDLFLEAAGPVAMMGKDTDGREMIIPYTSIKYVHP